MRFRYLVVKREKRCPPHLKTGVGSVCSPTQFTPWSAWAPVPPMPRAVMLSLWGPRHAQPASVVRRGALQTGAGPAEVLSHAWVLFKEEEEEKPEAEGTHFWMVGAGESCSVDWGREHCVQSNSILDEEWELPWACNYPCGMRLVHANRAGASSAWATFWPGPFYFSRNSSPRGPPLEKREKEMSLLEKKPQILSVMDICYISLLSIRVLFH